MNSNFRARRLCLLSALILLPAAAQASHAATRGPGHAVRDERIVLPTSVSPNRYRIEITPDATQLTFRGSVEIDVTVHQPVDQIVLNSADLVIDKAELDGTGTALAVSYDAARQTAAIVPGSTVGTGAHTLHLAYHGRIYRQSSGLFALDYGSGEDKRRALFTQFEVSDARRFVPCWDEPAIKAIFELTAVVPAAQMAVSNMPSSATESLNGGLKRVHFAATPKMSSYLLFFGLGEFEREARTVDDVEVGVVFKHGDAERARFALDAAAALLAYYNDYFGVRFPLPKLDLIAGPGASAFFGAMENWGAIFSFESDLLIDPRLATEHDRQLVYVVVAHEMAHQWFGDLVTMQWWTDIWLNEGFASWMEHKATDHFHPEWHMWLQFEQTRQRAMELDARRGTHPIITPVQDAQLAGDAFDFISYSKGAAVIRTLESYVGEQAFRAGVRRYMREHAYGNTVTDQLWNAVDREAARPITRIAHDLTLQAGVPMIIEQQAGCAGGQTHLELTQGRYVADVDAAAPGIWHVPVTGRTLGAASVTSVVAGPRNQAMSLPGCGAVILNAGQQGYFRSRYTAAGLAALSGRYRELSAEDQLGLLNDTQSLAYAGDTGMSSFLGLVDSVPVDAAPEVLAAQIGALHGMDRLFTDLPSQPGFRRWARSRLDPIIAAVGWDRRADEPDNLALTRAELLETLSAMDDAAVITEARRRFQAMQSGATTLEADSRHSALEIVAKHADQSTWDRLHEMARSATTELERHELYPLLGDAEDPALAQQALGLILSAEPPATLVAPMLHEAAVGRPRQTVEFTIAHWDRIQPMIEPVVAARLVPQLADSAADPALIDELESFAREHIPASAHRDVLKAETAIRWRDQIRTKRLPQADQWLHTRQPAVSASDAG